jgi:CBS-domain-containing membrane protein
MIGRDTPLLFARYLYRAVGVAIAIAGMELLARHSGEKLSQVPFVTSIVLVLTLPDSEASRPYSVLVGHAAACLAGLATLLVVGPGVVAGASGVGLAGFLMLALRAPHPPAGIDAFLITVDGLDARWVVNPVLIGCLLLVIFSRGWRWGEQAIFK